MSFILSDEDTERYWEEFRKGGLVTCDRDRAPFALNVDDTTRCYRLVCVQCGTSSAWFEASLKGFRVRRELLDAHTTLI